MAKLKDFLSQRWQPLGVQAPFWVDGSFTRKIEFPNDNDLVADVNDLPAAELAAILPLFCAREQIKTDFKVDFWLKHPFFPNDLTEFFRYAGTKVSAEIGIDPLQRKGILRVQL